MPKPTPGVDIVGAESREDDWKTYCGCRLLPVVPVLILPLAWGLDANGNATYAWYVNAYSFDEAEVGAVNTCISSGFQDCRVASSVANGSLAIASGNDGVLYADFGEDNGQAKRKALRMCKNSSKGCKIEEMLESPSVWISY